MVLQIIKNPLIQKKIPDILDKRASVYPVAKPTACTAEFVVGYVTFTAVLLSQQEQDRSPSPSPSPCTPPLDLATLHQQVDCNEPLRSLGNWSFAHRQPVSVCK